MAETTPVGAIDINALMAVANSTAVANKNNLALAEQNAKNRKLRDRVANVVRLNTEQSKAISEETENLKAYIEAEAVRQAESGKPNQKVLESYIKKYNSLLEKQTKIVDTINGL